MNLTTTICIHSEKIFNMLLFENAPIQDLETIQEIARTTWFSCYKEILSKEQIEYMLQNMYNDEVLSPSILAGNFYIIKEDDRAIGFVETLLNYPHECLFRIQKIYILPEYQGKGVGKFAFKNLNFIAEMQHQTGFHLNVNKYNPALNFYLKIGFKIIKEEVIDIGSGYVMDDYVLAKKIDFINDVILPN